MTKIIADIRKAIAAGTGLVAEGIAVGVLNSTDAKWATLVIGAVTTVLVYFVPNGGTTTVTPPPPVIGTPPPLH